jgi:trans-aconitate methyltransferase
MKVPSPVRVFRHFFLDKSAARYYSAEIWQKKYAVEHFGEYLSEPQEDGRFGAMLAILQRYDRGGPLLDAGCGDGLLWQRYRPLSRSNLIGIDYAPAAIEQALKRKIPNTIFEASDYHQFRVPEPCSLVVFNESLYYSDDYLAVLASMEKALKADGLLVISMWENAIMRRMWRRLEAMYRYIHAVTIIDEGSRKRWRIAVYPPARRGN